jgi:cation:H+ antiporter
MDATNIILFIASFALILVGCEFFTNAVEWLGKKLNLAEGAVGSVLAAVGTAMPETLVPLIAIIFVGGAAGEEIGVGAILGAPFMLATLALFVTGLAVYLFRKRRQRKTLAINGKLIRRDLKFFIIAYSIAAVTAFIPEDYGWVRWIVGCSLIPIYIYYTWVTLRTGESCSESECNALYLQRGLNKLNGRKRTELPPPTCAADYEDPVSKEFREAVYKEEPNLTLVIVQLIMGLTGIILGATIFVDQVESLAAAAGISATILALIIAPIATELPEKFNSVLWVKDGKDTYAIGNITGAMVFQSCFPVTIGILLTSWHLDLSQPTELLMAISILIALLSASIIYLRATATELKLSTLLLGGVFYAAFIGLVLFLT